MGNDQDLLRGTKTAIGVVAEIIRVAGDQPDVRKAGANLGKTALALTSTINNLMVPFVAFNFICEKTKLYFREHFEEELKAKIANIPEENIVEPKPYVVGPALQGLSFSHEEPDLKDLYLNLIASAMDDRTSGNTHPAFVEVIRQLTPYEATLLQSVLNPQSVFSVASIWLQRTDGGWVPLLKHLGNLTSPDGEPIEVPLIETMVENWKRLGLVEVDYRNKAAGVEAYAWVESRPELREMREKHQKNGQIVKTILGAMTLTSFGQEFGKAVGLLSKDRPTKQ
jgi:hypothetical protein